MSKTVWIVIIVAVVVIIVVVFAMQGAAKKKETASQAAIAAAMANSNQALNYTPPKGGKFMDFLSQALPIIIANAETLRNQNNPPVAPIV